MYPASQAISFLRDTALDLAVWGPAVGLILFVVWSNFLITAWSNAVNLTDGLDGLATGAALIFFGAYVLVGIWQTNQLCGVVNTDPNTCYEVRDPRDMAILAAAIAGACLGFLWWNASPAKIFMGDTGSLALGGAIAGMTIVSRTEILGGDHRRSVRHHRAQFGAADWLLQVLGRQAHLQNGAVASPLSSSWAGAR